MSTRDVIGRGFFAEVFSPPGSGIAYKVYYRAGINHPELCTILTAFRSELLAYEVAARDPELSRYLPAYYGPATIQRIVDAELHDRSSTYLLDVAFGMERLARRPIKLYKLAEALQATLRPIMDQFTLRRVSTLDASVLYDPVVPRFVDIHMLL